MSKKRQLLEEQNIKRFMRLSGQGHTLTENFLGKLNEMPGLDDEEVPPVDGEVEPELGLEPAGDEFGPGADEAVVKDLVDAIADAITAETGIDVSVTGDDSLGDEPLDGELPVDDELEMDSEEDLPDSEGIPLQEERDEIDEDLEAADVTVSNEDELVAEVARRVARRLLRETAKNRRKTRK